MSELPFDGYGDRLGEAGRGQLLEMHEVRRCLERGAGAIESIQRASLALTATQGLILRIVRDALDNRCACRACATGDLVDQQKQLLQDLDPDVRAGVVSVLRRLAQAADARFRAGTASENGAACRAPADERCACD